MKRKLKASDIKIGTPAEALWTRVRDKSQLSIETSEDEILVSKAILQLSNEKIKAEQAESKLTLSSAGV